jgi:hypothetical protein
VGPNGVDTAAIKDNNSGQASTITAQAYCLEG